jgi:GMP synthase (glutamine-hydrolysing)
MLRDDPAAGLPGRPGRAKGGEVKQRIVLVIHDDGPREDRASRFLVARGHAVEWTCPAQGGGLPEPGGAFDAAIVYGGLDSVNAWKEKAYLSAELEWIGRWIAAGKPYLGLCLGGQLLAHSLDGRVARHADGLHEHGFCEVRPTAAGRETLPGPLHVYQAHYEGFDLPRGAELLMTGETYANQGFRYGANAYGLQFHPEVTPRPHDPLARRGPGQDGQAGRTQPRTADRRFAALRRTDGNLVRGLSGTLACSALPQRRAARESIFRPDRFDLMGADRFSGQARCEARCRRIGRAPQQTRRTDPPHRRPGVFTPWRRCAALPMALHRHAKRAWPPHRIIPVKWFNLAGKCSRVLSNQQR